jgi:hypothetical protein
MKVKINPEKRIIFENVNIIKKANGFSCFIIVIKLMIN